MAKKDENIAPPEAAVPEHRWWPRRFSAPADVPVLLPQDPDIDKFAQMIGLPEASIEFRRELTAAVDLYLMSNAFHRPRTGTVRRTVLEVAKRAEAASKSLNQLKQALEKLGHCGLTSLQTLNAALVDGHRRPIEIDAFREEAKWLDHVSEAARQHSDMLTSRNLGGRPKLFAYDMFVRQLAGVYKRATGKEAKITWNETEQHVDGTFFRFEEAVLEKAKKLAQTTGRSLECPANESARGQYIKEITRARTGKRSR